MNQPRRFGPCLGLWVFAALGLALAAPAARAGDSPQEAPPKIAPEADAVLRRVGDHFAKVRSFRVDDIRRLTVGAVTVSQTGTIAFARPNRLAIRTRANSTGGGVDVVSDGRTMTVVAGRRKTYAQVTAPATLADLARQNRELNVLALTQLLGAEFLINLMTDEPHVASRKQLREATYVGMESEEGVRTHHLRLDTGSSQLDLWVDADGDPLPRRSVFTRGEGKTKLKLAHSFKHWQTDTDEAALFAIQPPARFRKTDSIMAALGIDPITRKSDAAESPLVGQPAPQVRLATPGGGTFDLAEQRGHVVILDFWATWCGPCVQELPILAGIATEYRSKGVIFKAINLREDEAKVAGFQREQGLSFPVALDADGAVAGAFGADAIPTTVLIDRAGVVRAVHVGFSPSIRGKLTAELDTLLPGRTPGRIPTPPATRDADGSRGASEGAEKPR